MILGFEIGFSNWPRISFNWRKHSWDVEGLVNPVFSGPIKGSCDAFVGCLRVFLVDVCMLRFALFLGGIYPKNLMVPL